MYAKLISPIGTTGQDVLCVEIINSGHNVIAHKYPLKWVKLDEKFDEQESFTVPITVQSYRYESSGVYPGREKKFIATYAVDVTGLTERQFTTLNRVIKCLYNQMQGMTNLDSFRFGTEKHHIRKED